MTEVTSVFCGTLRSIPCSMKEGNASQIHKLDHITNGCNLTKGQSGIFCASVTRAMQLCVGKAHCRAIATSKIKPILHFFVVLESPLNCNFLQINMKYVQTYPGTPVLKANEVLARYEEQGMLLIP